MVCYRGIIRYMRPHRSRMQKRITAIGYFVSGALIAALGCAGSAPGADWSKAHPDAMMVQKSRPVHMSGASVVVTVLQGYETPPRTSLPHITRDDFSQALRQSIAHSGLFAQAKRDGLTDYELQVSVAKVDYELLGSETTVSMEVSYILARLQPKQVVWEKVVASIYTAQLYGASGGAMHRHLATEGAARENIEQTMHEISQLQLD